MKIDTTKLQEKQIIKSYTELCELVGLKKAANKEQRERQLKKMELYFKVRRIDRTKYKVVKVYHSGVFENLVSTKATYLNEMTVILLSELLKSEDHKLHLTTNELLSLIGVVDDTFGDTNNNARMISQEVECAIECANELILNTKTKLRQILIAELNTLQSKKNLISFHEDVCVLMNNGEKHLESFDSNIRNKILQTEQSVIESLGCENIKEVYKKHKINEYEKKVAKKLSDNYNIRYYFRVITIEMKIEPTSIPMFTEKQIQDAQNSLKKEVSQKLREYLVARKDNYKKKVYRKRVGNEFLKERYKMLYPSNYRKCVDAAIKVLLRKDGQD